jgi:nitrogen regulatory protein PII
MKHLIAIIQPQQLPAVKKALHDASIEHMSCTNILGTIPNQDEHQSFRGVEHEITLFQKVRLEFFINDESLEPVIEAISTGGRATGGTGKIFVSELQDCVSVNTGAHGPSEI